MNYRAIFYIITIMRRTILVFLAFFLVFGFTFSWAAGAKDIKDKPQSQQIILKEEPQEQPEPLPQSQPQPEVQAPQIQTTKPTEPEQTQRVSPVPEKPKQEEAKQEDLTPPALAKPAKLVTAIEIQGNKAISSNTVISKMKTRIGSPYLDNVISDDLKRLYLLGFFQDIKIDTQDYKDGVKVIITVSERPLIEKIDFKGIVRITLSDEKLKGQLKSKEGQYLDYPSLSDDVQTFKKMYEKMGFSLADVTYKADINKETNKATITFNIVEGKKVRIEKITFTGNKAFSTWKLVRLIKTRDAWFFNAGILKEDVLKEDLERLRSFYRRSGYTDVTVESEVTPDPKKPYMLNVAFKINEGKKYLVGSISVQGNKDISEKEILSKVKECAPGKVFSQEALRFDSSNIQGLYFDRGYISAQVEEATSLNSHTGRVDISYKITENDISYINKIKIRGNVKTKDVVIRRELRVHPGDKFDGDKLKRSKERLTNLGYFEEISYDTEDTESSNKKDLIVDVKESKTGTFSFGGGYSTVDSFVGFVEIEQKNFDWRNWPYFTGAGQDLRFKGSFGTITSGFELSFTEPWLFDYPISFGFDAYRRSHKRDTDVGYGYDEKVTGGDLRLGKELSEYLRSDIMYKIEQMDISNISTPASNDLLQESGKQTTSSIIPSMSFDSRDNVFDTHKGTLISGSVEVAGGFLGFNKDFWKFYGRASQYFPMPRNSVLEVRGRAGLADKYSDTPRVPIYDRFFAGGAASIRGYEERSVGPVDPVSNDPLGGNAVLIGNIEYTYPVFSFIKLAAFYDVGNVWQKIGDIGTSKNANGVINSGGFKSGVGLGLRLKTPIGPIMLDYGIPLNKASGETSKKSGRIHFSASHGF